MKYGVSRSSLHRARISTKNGKPVGVNGAPGFLTKEEEQEIVNYCVREGHLGHPLTKAQLVDHVRVRIVCNMSVQNRVR